MLLRIVLNYDLYPSFLTSSPFVLVPQDRYRASLLAPTTSAKGQQLIQNTSEMVGRLVQLECQTTGLDLSCVHRFRPIAEFHRVLSSWFMLAISNWPPDRRCFIHSS
jgi:hypothetical protein